MTGEARKLSPRQVECVRWVAEGKTDAEIGVIMKLSPRTVRFHLDAAKAKLSVTTRCQLLVWAIKHGEITL